MKSFPPPLSAEDEQYYMEQYLNGDIEAKYILIEHNLRLVAHVIKKYQYLEEDQEDLLSIGTIGLIKAISTYNPSHKNRLAAYAARCIENEILMMLRTKKKTSRNISIYQPIGVDRQGNEIRLYDIMETEEDEIQDQISLKDDIRKLYEKLETVLTPREQLVLKLRYGLYRQKEYTQREIAARLGISRSYVSRIEKSAIEKLRPYF